MKITIEDVMHKLLQTVPRLESTVDVLRAGDPKMEVRAMATTFMATHEVIEQAAASGVNLLITHEGTFYSHMDQTDWLEHDAVYQAKQRLIEQSGIAIFRLHDGIHRYQPDGIMTGLIQALDWDKYVTEHQRVVSLLTLPAMSVKEIAEHVKRQMGISFVRVVGDPAMSCTRVGLLAGYRGGGAVAIPQFGNEALDLVIAGEGPEWETPEYVRDAMHQGKKKALILLGHAESEASGMKALAEQLAAAFPTVSVQFFANKPLFTVI
ncbi:Nif3-like dinuclear metal center hexameric protein [Paenibacillus aestuarii]|uniref:GTP cyclohydrolase 1 type 2 homolog n=1 Tax=Paenibacillus aestuarii TaxID=516965 RepID=A0ABW0K9N8_9BACL|nr:Nif3-like dinuclear metal center hexameric protein [Paenibacillus aestuarii]